MQINAANQSVNTLASQDVTRPKGPPPPPQGGVPPGLESAVSTLSDEEQSSVTDMLASLSKDQQSSLKTQLDGLRDGAESLSNEELGAAFNDILTSLSTNQSDSGSLNLVDTFA
ncbi:hypothetical protein [Paraglaciecola sp. L1A13]|uniref:hypothetical protein n=1 Tax=Paraglaciecola sp. L1A13 TaxID=2686359 RepID=UPI00131E0775|nr:hypothetical protein [Paraglaciecola sp. L1A13]|tara:strand:- start:686 stop:1027 length:342 start_codon:yes stop_codon:yes gene_type:complete